MAPGAHEPDNKLTSIMPPDRRNITEVAEDVRLQWMSSNCYCPNVCYVIEGGKMRLMTFVGIPDADSGRKLLFVVKNTHPRHRMVDYREDIYRELRAAGVDV